MIIIYYDIIYISFYFLIILHENPLFFINNLATYHNIKYRNLLDP